MRMLLLVTAMLLASPVRTSAGVEPAGSAGSKNQAPAASAMGFAAKSSARAEAVRNAPNLSPESRLASLREGIQTYRAVQALGLGKRNDLHFLSGVGAAEELARLEQVNGEELLLRWRPALGTPRLIQGRDLLPGVDISTDPVQTALGFLESNRHLLKIETPRAEFALIRVERDADDRVAVRFQQTFEGLEVWGHDILVRLSPLGRVTGFSGRHLATPALHQGKAIVPAGVAQQTALQALAARDNIAAIGQAATLLLFPDEGDLRLAWKVQAAAGLVYRKEAFVDAISGEFLHWVDLVASDGAVTGSGLDLNGQTQSLNAYQIGSSFLLIDTTQPMFDPSGSLPNQGKGVIHQLNAQNGNGQQLFHVTSNNVNNWAGSANSVSCATFGQQVFEYFLARHSRSSLDGNGMTMNMVVNFESNLNNAFWSSPFMVFGNGDGSFFTDLAGSLDVTGHEMSHGVVEHTANLVYQFQSGALNEHFADVFGTAVEFFTEGAGADWLMGEDVTTPTVAGDGLRDLESPGGPKAAGGAQPAHMDQFLSLPIEQDNGGVHGNSGIPNKAFYEATEPSSGTGGIGILKTE